jgi:hypothetical protein
VRFQPSAYSDAVAPFSPFAAVEGGGGGASPDAAGTAIDVAGKLATVGLDAWQRAADAKAAKWQKLAAKKAAARKKKAAAAAAAQQAAMTPAAPAPAPVQAAAAMNPMLKWGLIVGGVGLVGFALYMVLRKKEEPSKPKSNPKRVHIKAKPQRRAAAVRPAASEFAPDDAPVEEVEEVEDDVFAGPDDDYGSDERGE